MLWDGIHSSDLMKSLWSQKSVNKKRMRHATISVSSKHIKLFNHDREDCAATILLSAGKWTSYVRLTFDLFRAEENEHSCFYLLKKCFYHLQKDLHKKPWMSVHCYHIIILIILYTCIYEKGLIIKPVLLKRNVLYLRSAARTTAVFRQICRLLMQVYGTDPSLCNLQSHRLWGACSFSNGAGSPAAGASWTFGVISLCSDPPVVCMSSTLAPCQELRISCRAPGADHPPLFLALLKNQREIIFQDGYLSLHLHYAYYCIQERSKLHKLPSELAGPWRFFTVLE